jgi:hypothetical protein
MIGARFPFAFPPNCAYNTAMDSEATMLCETGKKLWWHPVAGNLWFHGTASAVRENGPDMTPFRFHK